ncbi:MULTISPECIES: NAD(P)/FAD-dependent oxidoreductase [Actibacterium]|uniref:Protoporphyrinogen oxidase n=1 Tax=Actibacterium naphthalenivorans TaxID=1614693 RepID=A0A840C9A6_9RHOB|nr:MULTISPECIES: NAD(P)/FAD-dependent oxidoreductase [Actibacterium]ALG89684.1 FAD-dependent oxidoreductase [Actibacterium sp. EMB200-NS6]MBB4020632.1 protoporphyrinogen oxidase [Actibacterium naphthalenivorans]
MENSDIPVVVIGGGPAGLTAAYELQKRSSDHRPIVFEASDMVGGIARTESHNGYRFDIGGHRFFTKVQEVEDMWHEVMGDDFITVPRQSRIYYKEKFFDYPLKLFNALINIGPYEAARIVVSYIKWQVRPYRDEQSFEEWVINRFGGRLYMHFFRSYTEKVWGIPPTEIRADWAAQRIKNLSLFKAVWNALSGANDTASLIEEFQYPRLGPGMMWEKVRDDVREKGGDVVMQSEVVGVNLDGNRVTSIDVKHWTDDGAPATTETVEAEHFINSMAIKDLIHAFNPPPPPEVIAAAERLKYRDFLIVTLVLDHADPFPDNWIYIHSPKVKVGRIQNFRAWSPEMLPNPDTASIGMEYFCQKGDGLWNMSDEELRALASKELEELALAKASDVIDAAIIRQPKAYPVYDGEYKEALDTIEAWLRTLENFQTVGRNGLHRYNNQDHSMLSAMLAARNVLGEEHDVWNVNVERSYHEEFEVSKKPATAKMVAAE